MSCSQSAPVCKYMHLCVSVYQNIQYISHSQRVSKGSYLFGLRVSFAWRPVEGDSPLKADQ